MRHHLKDGRYNIVPTFLMQPSKGIGAKTPPSTPGAASPVVFNGPNQVWDVKRQPNGTYYLTLEGGGKSIADPKQSILVNPSIEAGDEWHLEHRPGGFYLIMQHNEVKPKELNEVKPEEHNEVKPKLAWTLPKGEDNTPVVLQTAEEPYKFQEWLFRSVVPNA